MAGRDSEAGTGPGQATADLVMAAEHDDVDGVRRALDLGGDPAWRDGDDWNALDRAAGRGSVLVVRELLARGADPLAAGEDLRTPYQIALAAGQREAAEELRSAEETADPSSVQRHVWTPYCRAFPITDVRQFPGWQNGWERPEEGHQETGQDLLSDAGVVFVHDDLRVTRSMWRDTGVIFDGTAQGWSRFCTEELGFRVPDDFDLMPTESPNG